MLLSKPQKTLLEFLRVFGALREDQASTLLEAQYGAQRMEPVIRQLLCGGMIRCENGLMLLPDGKADADRIEAADIMLLLSPEELPVTTQRGMPPFSLTFFKTRGEKLWRYDICPVHPGKEPIVCAQLEGIPQKYRMIVFVLRAVSQRELLYTACEHCFAIKENGKFRFYK